VGIVTFWLAGTDRQREPLMMTKISYRGYRFPPGIIQHAIWLYVRFTLSFRDKPSRVGEVPFRRARVLVDLNNLILGGQGC
jgi:hypothetical protein